MRVRARIFGTRERPRLSVFRSNRGISAQLIDDEKGVTLTHAASRELPKEAHKQPKTDQAARVGALLAEKAVQTGIVRAVLDRRAYRYHGRVKALAEAARKAGLRI